MQLSLSRFRRYLVRFFDNRLDVFPPFGLDRTSLFLWDSRSLRANADRGVRNRHDRFRVGCLPFGRMRDDLPVGRGDNHLQNSSFHVFRLRLLSFFDFLLNRVAWPEPYIWPDDWIDFWL